MGDLRARRREQTRREVGEAALRLFVERGFDNVTVSEVAEAAGISRRTFFNHFDGKEDAALAGTADDLSVLAEALGRRADGVTFLDVFRAHVRHRVERDRAAADRHALRRRFEAAHPAIAVKGTAQRAMAEQRLIVPEIARDLRCEESDPRVTLLAGAFVGIGQALNDLLDDAGDRDQEPLLHQGLDLLAAAFERARAAGPVLPARRR